MFYDVLSSCCGRGGNQATRTISFMVRWPRGRQKDLALLSVVFPAHKGSGASRVQADATPTAWCPTWGFRTQYHYWW